MKFLPPIDETHAQGTRRSRRWFAVKPVTIDGETRWLETVTVQELWFPGYGSFCEPGWVMEKFL